mmetsp:Transcript_132761/g.331212  ORF Transcript_132761/g.331212 Transcript_132761/m.331212 type:complete len:479 (+) Transcript_132761:3-1439(+)
MAATPANSARSSGQVGEEPAAAMFAVQARGMLKGTTSIHRVEGLSRSDTVRDLAAKVQTAFGPEAAGAKLQIFAGGQELERADQRLAAAKIGPDSVLQVRFVLPAASSSSLPSSSASALAPARAAPSPSPTAASATAAATTATATAAALAAPVTSGVTSSGCDGGGSSGSREAVAVAEAPPQRTPPGAEQPLPLRAQGLLNGKTAQAVDGMTTASAVWELEEQVAAAFEAGPEVGMRMVYMGKELKDPNAQLGSLGMASGCTVNVAFIPGKARLLQPSDAVTSRASAAATAASQGSSGSGSGAGCVGGACSLVAPAAPEVSAPLAGALAPSPGAEVATVASPATTTATAAPVDPGEAWQAMAMLETQLAAATDPGAEENIKQFSAMLRPMLATVVHESNPALLQLTMMTVPDLAKVWAYEPTKKHLIGLLSGPAPDLPSSSGAAASSGGGGSAATASSSSSSGGAAAAAGSGGASNIE